MGTLIQRFTVASAMILAVQCQPQFMEYIERRLSSFEDRIAVWYDQTQRYSSEYREFKNQILALVESLDKEKEEQRSNLEIATSRIERLERELDYLENRNPVPTCLEMEEKLIDQTAERTQEKKKRKHKVAECEEMVFNIKAMKIVKRLESAVGLWTKDLMSDSEKVYIFDGVSNDTVYEFTRLKDFTDFTGLIKGKKIKLPHSWAGTGHIVYRGFLYYIRSEPQFQVIKFDLKNQTVSDSGMFPAERQIPVYGLSPYNYIDLAADENGLWAIYATRENEKNICLARLDHRTLDIEQMWDTPCPIENAENAFVICGMLYVVYNSKLRSRSRVQCVYDVTDMVNTDQAPLLYFPKRFGAVASIKYNPKEKQLYSWDDGNQIIYRLNLKLKSEL
ncbi:olfactomedin-like protein 3 [Amblyraja radiata]|uniref:olfactomedin-like protein 3 n=1 Tax=Amblyraja radiata TaxID=386614 RepID=UPI001403C9CA|nr:olfactomedin-like protein 3 [Amblyraja radiata]